MGGLHFAWNVFMLWENLKVDSRDKKTKRASEWMFHCLAYLGGDWNVGRLVSYIKSWPKEGGMPRAVTGLDILASIGSDSAIRAINAILLKTKYKPLLERGEEIMDNIAELRGLNKAQLDDRLVPTFGLDDPEAFVLDFGARQFSVEINEKLVPTLFDSDNKLIKALPKPAKGDDNVKAKEATGSWKNLQADLKREASTQLLRFEQAMLTGRQWSVADFRSLLVAHPILCTLVRHLIWAEVREGKTGRLFRVSETGDYIDVNGLEITLLDDSKVCIPHPLHIQKALDTWKATLIQHKLKQPVRRQLG